jgi:hypothetical protein
VFRELTLERLVQSSLLRGELLPHGSHFIGHLCNEGKTGIEREEHSLTVAYFPPLIPI